MTEQMEKKALIKAISDMRNDYTKETLERIIHNEFFNDHNPLDCDLVDAAVIRIMRIDGQRIDDATLQNKREHLIYSVLKRVLVPKK